MDAGGVAIVGAVAGLVGAVIGAAGSVGAAAMTGRRADRSQHAHWRRQTRRETYAAFATAANSFLDDLLALTTYKATGMTYVEFMAECQELWERVKMLYGLQVSIELDGPAEVAEAARQVTSACARLVADILAAASPDQYVAMYNTTEVGSTHADAEAAHRAFRVSAREALDSPSEAS
ncbi:hypothetical protein [Streptomyces diastatochromogenes]|uniref:hypothetical protein n=1 Tax=Streptomyces diastatochromogenes TaxID=42236 RepID=UPI003691A1DD